MLPKPTDERMMISYLLLRIVDTIEDSQAALETKSTAFSKLISLLRSGGRPEEKVADFKETLCGEIDHSYERGLLENVGSVLAVFSGFSDPVKSAITDCADEMARGMMKFQTIPIIDLARQEEYCHYVAGIVGHLDTRLFQLGGHISESLRRELMDCANSFGIALQKVNVLRDVAYDIPQGRRFWPQDLMRKRSLGYENLCSEEMRPQAMELLDEMVKDALPYLDAAIEYVTRLPRTAVRIRVFCLIPLFMAIKSYARCVGNENVFIKGKKVKIGREEVRGIVRLSFLLAPSNWALRRWFNSSIKPVTEKVSSKPKEAVPV
jgi:farnesyl-diphosphate farnesyltransferase